jgi:superfamily II DNA or RNA helicase
MDKSKNAQYRFGFTGTLSGSKTHETCLIGLFGKIHQVTTTVELMEQGHIADFKIKGLLLKYPEHVRSANKKLTYQEEVKFLITCPERNRFIRNLIISLKGNTLVLFRHIEHGKFMFEETKKKLGSDSKRKVFYIAGSSDADEREAVRKIIEIETDAIIFGSRGTMSTGSNTKSLHNLVFASPSKSKISTLQSIGRSLRKSKTKEAAILYDIADDLHWKSKLNYTLDHFKERVKIYMQEKFKFKLYEIDLTVKEQ